MRRLLTALSAVSLFSVFPLALGYLPYDHWDHTWASVNIVVAAGLVCLTLCAALVLARSSIRLTRRLLLGIGVVSAIASSLGAPVFGIIGHFQILSLLRQDAIGAIMFIALAALPAILACNRKRVSARPDPPVRLSHESLCVDVLPVFVIHRLPLRI